MSSTIHASTPPGASNAGAASSRTLASIAASDHADSQEFREIARAVSAVDTLEAFLRDMRARYPETGSFTPVDAAFGPAQQSRAPTADRSTTGSLPDPAPAMP